MTFDRLKEEYINGAKQFYPEIDFGSIFSMYSGNLEGPSSAQIEFTHESNIIRNVSNIDNQTKQLIHYTNIESAINIINSAEIRMYNLNKLNDKTELNFALKKINLKFDEAYIQSFKQNLFVLSFSEFSVNENSEDFNLWRLYGDNGYGIGLVFELENYQDEWLSSYLGKVFYGEDNDALKKLNSFLEFHENFNKTHNFFQNTPNIIPLLSLLHKNEIWKIENEYRLFAHCPFDSHTLEPTINNHSIFSVKHTINKNGQKTAYISLPLNSNKIKRDYKEKFKDNDYYYEEVLKLTPRLILKQIILGHNLSNEIGRNFYELSKTFYKNLEDDFVIKFSKFKDY